MKFTKNTFFILFLFTSLPNLFCTKERTKCSDVADILSFTDATIRINFKRASGEYLLKQSGGVYKPSDVKVYDSNNKEIKVTYVPIDNSGGAYWVNVPMSDGLSGVLRTGVAYQSKYTLSIAGSGKLIEYDVKGVDLECGSQAEYLNVKYDGQQVVSATNTLQAEFTINQ